MGLNIFKLPLNPICILKKTILSYFEETYKGEFKVFEDLSPIVTTKQAFDDILIPKDHVSRRKSDTYYIDATHVLRPHTRFFPKIVVNCSAHQVELLANNLKSLHIVVMKLIARIILSSLKWRLFEHWNLYVFAIDLRIVESRCDH